LADLALSGGADVILFPELSLTGYEPQLAQELAMDPTDRRLDAFQLVSDRHQVTLGLGMPVRGVKGIYISLVFKPIP
jgi:predicted amidohydrolase